MTDAANRPAPIPEHLGTVTPRLMVVDGAAAIEFYRDAFGAEEVGERFTDPDGKLIHAEVRIGSSVVMVSEDAGDASAPARSPHALGGVVSAVMATYWNDVDAAWQRAVAAGGPRSSTRSPISSTGSGAVGYATRSGSSGC